jgi:hypothetical protein
MKAPNGALLKWIHDHAGYRGDDCLIWPFSRMKKGYPCVVWPIDRPNPKSGILAARYMCQLVNGPPPTEDHDAAHSCGRGTDGCMTPNHLRWASSQENADDRRLHGTNTVGVRHPQAKLNDLKVRRIRRSKADLQTLADKFGVSIATISMVRSHKAWRHVDA